jgi:type IV secretory pathway VirJ component
VIVPLLLTVLAARGAASPAAADTAIRFGRFGQVTVYRPAGALLGTALFFSGDGGWNEGVVDMASSMARSGTLVIGVDTPKYLKAVDAGNERCSYLAADAEALSQYAQKELGLPNYQPPLLVGYSSGAGLAYATLAQAPDNTFTGALSLAFDPHLPMHTPLCERNGLSSVPAMLGPGRQLSAVPRLSGLWIILHGDEDRVWPADSAAAFVGAVSGAELVRLPKVGHGFSVPGAWLSQFKDAVARFRPKPTDAAVLTPAALGDLPVVPLPMPANPVADYFAIILSGDGGWASIDKQLGEELVRAGVPTVGFNSLQYFWRKRTPGESSNDLETLIRYYQGAFHREKVALIGYSRGADVLPLMASRLPASVLDRVHLMAFLGIEHETNLEFRLGDWLGAQHQAPYQLLPELQRLSGRPMLCVYGAREGDTLCPDLPAGLADVVRLEGGHHFDGDFRALARLIMDHIR